MRVQSVAQALIPFIILAIFGVAHAATPTPDRLSASIIPPGPPEPTPTSVVFVVVPPTVVPPATVVEPTQPAPTTIPPEPTESPSATEEPVSAVTIAPVGGSGVYGSPPEGSDHVPDLVVAVFPEYAEWWLSVIWCESRFDPGAINGNGNQEYWAAVYEADRTLPPGPRYLYIGLAQIDAYYHQAKAEELYGPGANLFNSSVNLHTARYIAGEPYAPTSAWSCR